MAVFKSIADLSDVVSFIAYCLPENSLMLTLESTSSEYWIPTAKVPPGECWDKYIQNDIVDTFGMKIIPTRVLRIYKIWIPEQPNVQFLYHCVYELQVTADQKKKAKGNFGKYKGKIRWVTEAELLRLNANNTIKSPEVCELFMLSKHGINNPAAVSNIANLKIRSDHFIYRGTLVEIPNSIISAGKPVDANEQMAEVAGLDRTAQEILYKEFMFMCYPACYMSCQVFTRFLLEAKWPKEESPNLYRAADIENRHGITYREFLYFIAATEPSTTHGGSPAEIRCRYIFRYYDKDRDNMLNSEEFKNLIITGRQLKKQALDNVSVAKEASECYRYI